MILRDGTYSLILFTFCLELFLFEGRLLQVLDRLLETHHVAVGALVCALGRLQLLLQLLVLLFLHPQILHY